MNNQENKRLEERVRWYKGISPALTVLQLSYFYASSKFLVDNLEDSRILQATVPLYIIGTIMGSLLLREGYVKTIGLANRVLKTNKK